MAEGDNFSSPWLAQTLHASSSVSSEPSPAAVAEVSAIQEGMAKTGEAEGLLPRRRGGRETNSGQIVSLLATSAALFGLALHLWAWRHLRDAAAKRRVWSSSILFGAMLILLCVRMAHISESFRVAMAALAGGMVLASALLGASRINLSNDPQRNAWCSGLLQGLTIALAVVVLTLMALASMRI